MSSRVRLALLIFTRFLFPLTHAKCFFPDGKTVATLNVPCYNDGGNSTCRGPGHACLSNNICQYTSFAPGTEPTTIYIRGSCTDPTWTDSNCPLFCDNPTQGDSQTSGIGMGVCLGSKELFYCEDSTQASALAQCDSPQAPLVIFSTAFSTVTIIGVTTTTSGGTVITTVISSTTAAATTSTSGAPDTGNSTASSSSTSSSSDKPTSSSKSDDGIGTVVGAGVGVPLGVIAITIAGWFIFRAQRIRKKDKAQAAAEGAASKPQYSELSQFTVTTEPYLAPKYAQAYPAELPGRYDPAELSSMATNR